MNAYFAKPIIKALFVFSFTFLFFTNLQAQKQIFNGYYIGVKEDSVRGTFPDYSQWSKNPRKVNFLPSTASTAIQLTPANCSKFVIENFDTYVSFEGERLINPIEFEQAVKFKDSIGFANISAPVSTFLRFVGRTGNCEIYVLNDNMRTNFYYRLDKEPFTELKFKMYYDQNRVNEVYEYRQQVNALFKQEIQKRKIEAHLEKLEYTEESLLELLNKLTPEQKRKVKIKNPAEGLVVSLGVSANLFAVKNVDAAAAGVNTKYNTSFSPFFSIGYMSPANRNFNRFFIYPHVNVYSFKNSGDGPESSFRRKTTFKANLVAAPILNLGVNVINTAKLKYFLSGGGGILFLVNNQQETQTAQNTTVTKLLSMSYNINLSTGITLNNKMMATAAYNLPASMANYMTYNPVHSSIQFSIGYKF
jgi:hypothetical protein